MGTKTNQIATEAEAKAIGSSTGAVIPNMCVTKIRATALLCAVDTSTINYEDNQLVRYQDLSASNTVKLYLDVSSSLFVSSSFNGNIQVAIQDVATKIQTVIYLNGSTTSSHPMNLTPDKKYKIIITPTNVSLANGKYLVESYNVQRYSNSSTIVTTTDSFTAPNYDCKLMLLTGAKYLKVNLTYNFDTHITEFNAKTPYHNEQTIANSGYVDHIIYKDNFTISGKADDFYDLKCVRGQAGGSTVNFNVSTNRYNNFNTTLEAYKNEQYVTINTSENDEYEDTDHSELISILSVANSTAQRHLSLTKVTETGAHVRTPDNTYRQIFDFTEQGDVQNGTYFESTTAAKYDFSNTVLPMYNANDGTVDMNCVYTDVPGYSSILFAVPLVYYDVELTSIRIVPCAWSDHSNSFVMMNSEGGLQDEGTLFSDILSHPRQHYTIYNTKRYLDCDFDETLEHVLCRYVYEGFIPKYASADELSDINNDDDPAKYLCNMIAIQLTYGNNETDYFCVLYRYDQDSFNPFDSVGVSPIPNKRYEQGTISSSVYYNAQDIPFVCQDLVTAYSHYTHLLDKQPFQSQYMDFDANVGIFQFGELCDFDESNLQEGFAKQSGDLLWGFRITVPKLNEDLMNDIIINLRLGNFNILGPGGADVCKTRYELAEWIDYGNGTGFFNENASVYNAWMFSQCGISNVNLADATDQWSSGEQQNQCISVHCNNNENAFYVVFNITGMYRSGLIFDRIYERLISANNDYFSLLFTVSSGGRTWACINHLLPEIITSSNYYIDGAMRSVHAMLHEQIDYGSCFEGDIEIRTMNGESFNGILFKQHD